MDWKALIKLIIEIIMKLLAQERAAAVNGFDGPVTAAVNAYKRVEALPKK